MPRLKRRTSIKEHITPHRVRHILVTYVEQRHRAYEAVVDQMAFLMGHAYRMWQVGKGGRG